MTRLDYRQIYEDKVRETLKTSLEMPRFYADFSHQMKMFIEEVADAAVDEAHRQSLDPENLQDVAELIVDTSRQLEDLVKVLGPLGSGFGGEEKP